MLASFVFFRTWECRKTNKLRDFSSGVSSNGIGERLFGRIEAACVVRYLECALRFVYADKNKTVVAAFCRERIEFLCVGIIY